MSKHISNHDILIRVFTQIDSYRDTAVELQRHLTRLPALAPENGGEGENQKAEMLRQWLATHLHPDALDDYPAPDDRILSGHRPNMIARFHSNGAARTVWIMSHLDVVPPGDMSKWSGDPYQLRVQPDTKGRTRLIGRGTEDNQQGLVSSVLAVKALRDLNILPHCNIGLIFVADEETGNDFGIKYLLKHHRRQFDKSDLFIIPDAGNHNGTMIEVAEKSILWLRFQVTGKQTHASEPDKGRNAHKAGSQLIVKLEALYRRFRQRDATFDPPISTFEPTRRSANVPNVNTIPGEDEFFFDCRVLPQYKLVMVIQEARAIAKKIASEFKVKIKVTPVMQVQAAPPTPAEAPVVKALAQAIRTVRGVRPRAMGIGGGTVAAFFRKAGIPAAVWSTMEDTAHSPNEFCLLENLLDDAKVFAYMFLQSHA